jgi:hypothetical protein
LIVTTKHQGRLGEEQGIWIATSAKLLNFAPCFFGATSPHNPPLNNATISTESQAFFCFWHLLRWYTRDGAQTWLFFCSGLLLACGAAKTKETRLYFSIGTRHGMAVTEREAQCSTSCPLEAGATCFLPAPSLLYIASPHLIAFLCQYLLRVWGSEGRSRRRPAWCQLAQKAGGHSFDMMMMLTTFFSSRRK